MVAIAGGFFILGTFAGSVPIWGIPLLMLPIAIGTSVFNPINNAAVMSSLAVGYRGFASGMLETTREMGHAVGATLSATALAMALPVGILLLSDIEAQPFYVQGFQLASMLVVLILLTGGIIAYFHKTADQATSSARAAAASAAGDD